VPLLAAQHAAGEGLEAQVGRIGMRDREQVLRVEVAQLFELGGDEAREEVALEVRVVGDDGAPREGLCDGPSERGDLRCAGYVGVGESRQALHGTRHRAARANQALESRQRGALGLDQHQPDLEDLGAGIARESGGLEVDDRQRAHRPDEVRQRAQVDLQLAGIAPRRQQRGGGGRNASASCP
jgi:hypothetical protein